MKVYLTGPLLGSEYYSEMAQAAYRMPAEYEVKTPLDSIETDSPNRDPEVMKTILSKRIQQLLSSDMLVTMDHCDVDPVSKSEVALARTADMKVVPYWKFMKEHGQA